MLTAKEMNKNHVSCMPNSEIILTIPLQSIHLESSGPDSSSSSDPESNHGENMQEPSYVPDKVRTLI